MSTPQKAMLTQQSGKTITKATSHFFVHCNLKLVHLVSLGAEWKLSQFRCSGYNITTMCNPNIQKLGNSGTGVTCLHWIYSLPQPKTTFRCPLLWINPNKNHYYKIRGKASIVTCNICLVSLYPFADLCENLLICVISNANRSLQLASQLVILIPS